MTYTVDKNDAGKYVDEYTGKATKMAVKSMETVHGDAVAASDYQVAYYSSNANGKFDASDKKLDGAPSEVGNYIIAVYPKDGSPASDLSGYEDAAVIAQEFSIAPQQLTDVTAYEVNDQNENDVSDTTFTYTGSELSIGFAKDGKPLDANGYDVVWSPSAPKDAGTYTATLVGKNQYIGSKLTLTVEVGKLDISNLVVGDVATTNAASTAMSASNFYIDGKPISEAVFNSLNKTAISADYANGTHYAGKEAEVKDGFRATYNYQITPESEAEKNITGSADVIFNVVTTLKTGADFMYNGKPLTDLEAIDLSKDKAFDPSKLGVSGLSYDDGQFAYEVTKDGQPVTSYDEPGQYVVTVNVTVPRDLTLGGTATQKFTVTKGAVTEGSIFVAIDGKNVSSTTPGTPTSVAEYDGTEHVPSVVVKAGSATLEEGADYTVEVTTEVDGEDVQSSVVNAGTYAIKVTPSAAYGGEAAAKTLYASVEKMPVYSVEEANEFGIVWTGEPVAPAFKAINKDGDLSFDMAADKDYTVKYYQGKKGSDGKWAKDTTKPVAYDKIIDAGVYFAMITISQDSANFKASYDKEVQFSVVKSIAYADVAADAWYADEVYTAASDGYGYMTGIPGTKLFMPEASITRAQTAQVLYNMAGGDLAGDYYETGFSDVPGWDWAAKAVFWASQAGVVTGYPGTGLFGASDEVTREQAATMLYRYVKAQGKDVSATADLSAYVDGASVSDWAAEAMQWAVANDVFGVNTDTLRPQESLSRAEMAAIAVRVQPDGAIEQL